MLSIEIKKLTSTASIPTRAHTYDAGLDLYSDEGVLLQPNDRKLISTGIAVNLAGHYVGFVAPRSGLGVKGITVVNAPGIIDAGYTGEVKVNLINLSDKVYKVVAGERIAQLVVQRIALPNVLVVEEFTSFALGSERGEQGHGSTGSL
jgi:dUTP pyrophosphatase